MDDERRQRITELAKRAYAALTDEEREQQAVAYALAQAEAAEATALLNAAIAQPQALQKILRENPGETLGPMVGQYPGADGIRPYGHTAWSQWPTEALQAALQREIADATAGRGGSNLEGIQRELARRQAAAFPGALQ